MRKMIDSGIEWLGEVPESWSILRFKDVVTIHNGRDYKEIELEEGGFPVYGSGGVFSRASEYIWNKPSVLLGRKGTIDKPLYVDTPFWTVDTMFYTSKKRNSDMKYLYYYSTCFKYDYYATSTALPSMTQNDLGSIKLAVPSIEEQKAISSFLDKKCSRIDLIITRIKKQIELIEDYKKSLINETVTKGLDKTANMKDSGIDIVGKIKEDFDVVRLKYLCQITTGSYDTQDAEDEGMYNFYVRSPKVEKINTYDFDGEAILMAGDGVGAGKVFHYSIGKIGVHQRVYILHEFRDVNPKYLHYYLSNRFCVEVEKGSAKSTVDSIRMPMLKNFMVVTPAISEQHNISNFLDEKCTQIDAIINKKEKQIALIEEHRRSLIYEYVTGKKRVEGYHGD